MKTLLKLFDFPIIVILIIIIGYLLVTCAISGILAGILPSAGYSDVIECPIMWIFTFIAGFFGLKMEGE